MGIVRADGRVATRNYIGILSTVNCSATVARGIADQFTRERLAAFPNVDGVVALTHGSGCGMDTQGEGMQLLRRTLGGYARHANFAGVLIVGLGCEANQISALLGAESLEEGPLLRTFTIQDTGGTAKTIAHGIALIEEMLPHANDVTREPVPASHITVGLQCGGSDGYSGITANPALGAAVDLLVRHGGTAILSETPEIYGAEHLLTRRAVSPRGRREAGRAHPLVGGLHARATKGEMNNNPSPGNKAGGLTTILEKSLGAVAKGGTTNLVDVYEYAEPVDREGLRLHGYAGLRPGVRDRPGGRRREHDRVHDRPRLGLRLRAVAVAQALDQHARCGSGRRRTSTSTAARSSTASPPSQEIGERLFRMMLDTASGARIEERAARLRAERVRAVVSRGGDVATEFARCTSLRSCMVARLRPSECPAWAARRRTLEQRSANRVFCGGAPDSRGWSVAGFKCAAERHDNNRRGCMKMLTKWLAAAVAGALLIGARCPRPRRRSSSSGG